MRAKFVLDDDGVVKAYRLYSADYDPAKDGDIFPLAGDDVYEEEMTTGEVEALEGMSVVGLRRDDIRRQLTGREHRINKADSE